MFVRHSIKLLINTNYRLFHTSVRRNKKEFEHPLSRTWRILKGDFARFRAPTVHDQERTNVALGLFPREADVIIIGGGAVGASIAYWIKEKSSRDGLKVMVIEKDMKHTNCSTSYTLGAMHQQFSLPENIQMSLFGSEFIRLLKKSCGLETDVEFTPHGFLTLANEEAAERLLDYHSMQKEFGALNQLLTRERLLEKFPWLNVTDIELGNLTLERGGWFDPWTVLTAIKAAAQSQGTHFVEAEAVDFNFKTREDCYFEGMEDVYEALEELVIKMPDGSHQAIKFAYCIVAAGLGSIEVAQAAKIGSGSGLLAFGLPIHKRDRYVGRVVCRDAPPSINFPMTHDTSGVCFRRNNLGGAFLAEFSPYTENELTAEDVFKEMVVPTMKHRVPAFENLELTHTWKARYESNFFDDSGIIGPHPYYHNLYFATGFSKYGMQQAPAIGRAISELLLDGDYQTIDLTRFSFDRLIVDKPMYELAAY